MYGAIGEKKRSDHLSGAMGLFLEVLLLTLTGTTTTIKTTVLYTNKRVCCTQTYGFVFGSAVADIDWDNDNDKGDSVLHKPLIRNVPGCHDKHR